MARVSDIQRAVEYREHNPSCQMVIVPNDIIPGMETVVDFRGARSLRDVVVTERRHKCMRYLTPCCSWCDKGI
jgi:hypothetical protein